ncbi:hypothetical protein AB0M92_18930 [Streptomyces sp. NPDC051582]|uniref:hypothetical protein n=1 Tax=Streptomyces sp. NPDC051582 TaxID=3155167 RepID=UPI00344923C4
MQHATPEAYRAEAAQYREIADQHEKTGRLRLAEQFRDRADDCDERAAALETR